VLSDLFFRIFLHTLFLSLFPYAMLHNTLNDGNLSSILELISKETYLLINHLNFLIMKNQLINYFNLKTIFFLGLFLISSCFVNAQISVNSNGAVKLVGDLNISTSGTSSQILPDESNAALIGDPMKYFYQIWSYNIKGYNTYSLWSNLLGSDKRIKENFRDIENPLPNLLKLKGWKYDYKPDASDSTLRGDEKEKIKKLKQNRQGFIAQEVLDIFPDAVVYEKKEDRYYLDYNYFIPLIVEAMKEQQTTIEKLTARIETLEGNSVKEKSVKIDDTALASLDQNIPNPFSENTAINLYLPNTVSRATLYIYNMQGEQIKYIAVNERGNTSVTIEGHTLKAGMYLYTLIADGKEVNTKRMILTK
jgi:hypothetical protein